jgi:tetratricopeptide (TPR) repeat protein
LRVVSGYHSTEAIAARAELRLAASVARFFQGRFEAAYELALAGAVDAEKAGDDSALAQAHLQLEMSCSELGREDRTKHGRRALELFESLGDDLGLANLHLNLGVSAWHEGRWNDALDHFHRSVEAYVRAGDAVGAEAARNNLAETLTFQGRFEEAEQHLRDARRALKAATYRIGIAITASGQARIAVLTGDFEEARRLLDEARQEFVELKATNMVVDTDIRRVELLVWSGRPADALALADGTQRALDELGSVAVLPATLTRLRGWAHALAGDLGAATCELRRALELAREGGVPYEILLALDALECVRQASGAPSDPAAVAERDRLVAELGVVAIPRPPGWDAPIPAAPPPVVGKRRRRDRQEVATGTG